MFSKLNSILKPRPGTPVPITDDEGSSKADVIGRVKDLHPNLSIFHEDDSDAPTAAPGPSLPPSGYSKGGIFKRMSRLPNDEAYETITRIGLPKKVKSSLASLAIGAPRVPDRLVVL